MRQQYHTELGGSPETLEAIDAIDRARAADALLDAQLHEVGCPYGCNDFRARIWLDGYQACLASAMSASGQDAQRLEAKPASAVPERQTPHPFQSPPLSQGDE